MTPSERRYYDRSAQGRSSGYRTYYYKYVDRFGPEIEDRVKQKRVWCAPY